MAMKNDSILGNPICNELLVNSSDIIKDSYLKLLGVVLRQGNSINEHQMTLFKKIVAGVDIKYEAIDYLRRAKQFTDTDLKVFIEVCCEPALQYRFLLDSILLSGLGKSNKEYFELIAILCDILNIDNDVVRFLASMAKAVIEMDLVLYSEAFNEKPNFISISVFNDYYLLFQKYKYEFENLLVVQNPSKEQFITLCETEKNIAFINADIDLKQCFNHNRNDFSNSPNGQLLLKDKSRALFLFCRIEGGTNNIKIENCQEVLFYKTKLLHFSKRVFEIGLLGKMQIEKSSFFDCFYKHDRYASHKDGGIIYSESHNNGKIVMSNSQFTKCGTWATGFHFGVLAISNIDCEIHNCEYKYCWVYHKMKYGGMREIMNNIDNLTMDIIRDHINQKHALFTNNSNITNCKTVLSAPLKGV